MVFAPGWMMIGAREEHGLKDGESCAGK